jgi:hypothetical protein
MEQLHASIRQIINKYREEVERNLPGVIHGLYIYGSIALGEYYCNKSDIDFVTTMTRKLTQEEINMLASIHRSIESLHEKPNMNGIYLQISDLGKYKIDINPFPYYLEGNMCEAGLFEINSVTWYELKHHGITVFGPNIRQMGFIVDWDSLISNMKKNLDTYWSDWIKRFETDDQLFFGESQLEWGVLGVTRLYYTFREQAITTKARAGRYALNHVPAKWHDILNLAIDIRMDTQEGQGDASMEHKRRESLEYMRFIVDDCNNGNKLDVW